MRAAKPRKVGLVSYVLTNDVVEGWPGHHQEVRQAMAEADCDVYVTSVFPRAARSFALREPSPPEPGRLALEGAYSGSGERTVAIRYRGSDDVLVTERAVPGKPGDQSEVLQEFSEDELPRRLVQDGVFLLIEREINLLTYGRSRGGCQEVLPISAFLIEHDVSLVAHTAAKNLRRWETNPKREWLSRGRRLVVAVWSWNTTGHAEPKVPWRVFFDGAPRYANEITGLPYARLATVDLL